VGVIVPEPADRDLAERDRAATDGDVLLVDLWFGVRAAPVQRDRCPLIVGQRLQGGGELGGAGAERDERQPGGVQFAQPGAGGDFGVKHQQRRGVTRRCLPVTRERDHLPGLVGLGARGVGVEQVAGFAVLDEERQDGFGALRTPRDVVRFQGDVVTEVHDRVEVQIEVGTAGLPGLDHRPGQFGQQRLVVRAREPVAVAAQRAGFR